MGFIYDPIDTLDKLNLVYIYHYYRNQNFITTQKHCNMISPVPKPEQCDNSNQLGLVLSPESNGQFCLTQELDGYFPPKPVVRPPVEYRT